MANSLTCLGEACAALLEAVRARQELRHALCRKTPEHVRMRIMTSEVFTTNLMSDQTWSECHTLLPSIAPSASEPHPKTKGDSKSKPKALNRPKSLAHHLPPPPPSTKVAGTQGKGKFSSSFRKKEKKGPPTSSAPPPPAKPSPSTSSKN